MLAGFSVVCGVALKNLRPKAVRYTKILVLAQLGVTALFSMIVVLYFRSAFGFSHSAALKESLVSAFVWTAIWIAIYGYLLVSERVRATYGDA